MKHRRIVDKIINGKGSLELIELENGLKIVLNKLGENNEHSVNVCFISNFPSALVTRGYVHLFEHIYVEPHITKYHNKNIDVNAHVGAKNEEIVIESSFEYTHDSFLNYKTDSETVIKSFKTINSYLSEFIDGLENKYNQERVDKEKSVILSERETTGTKDLHDWIIGVNDLISLKYFDIEEFDKLNLNFKFPKFSRNIIGSEDDIKGFKISDLNRIRDYVFRKDNSYILIEAPNSFFEDENVDVEFIIKHLDKVIKSFNKIKPFNREILYPKHSMNKEMLNDLIEKVTLRSVKETKKENYSILEIDHRVLSGLSTLDSKNNQALLLKFNAIDKEVPILNLTNEPVLPYAGFIKYVMNSLLFDLRTKYRGFYSIVAMDPLSISSWVPLRNRYELSLISLTSMTEENREILKNDLENGSLRDYIISKGLEIINDKNLYEEFFKRFIKMFVFNYGSNTTNRYIKEHLVTLENKPELIKGKEFWDQKGGFIKVQKTLKSEEYIEGLKRALNSLEIVLIKDKEMI